MDQGTRRFRSLLHMIQSYHIEYVNAAPDVDQHPGHFAVAHMDGNDQCIIVREAHSDGVNICEGDRMCGSSRWCSHRGWVTSTTSLIDVDLSLFRHGSLYGVCLKDGVDKPASIIKF